jgi:hypothetical protein
MPAETIDTRDLDRSREATQRRQAAILQAVRDGGHPAEVGPRFGVTPTRVYVICKRSGVPIQNRHCRPATALTAMGTARRRVSPNLRFAGVDWNRSNEEIAADLHVTVRLVKSARHDLGWPLPGQRVVGPSVVAIVGDGTAAVSLNGGKIAIIDAADVDLVSPFRWTAAKSFP